VSVQISTPDKNHLLLHVVEGELGVVHGVLRSVDVVVRILERALDTNISSTLNPMRETHAKADW